MSDATERRRERRARHAATAAAPSIRQISYGLPVFEVLDEQGLERLHQASMRILSEFGIDFFDAVLIEKYVAMAPRQFTQLARNPDHNVVIGGNQVVFAPVYGPPFVQDLG